jgi:ectoine hydroxylase-related dioxygenase (phytanoyl-CoA dioxygenase family)
VVQLAWVNALDHYPPPTAPPRAAPGSHRWDEGRYPSDGELVAAEMQAGSAVVYLGSTIHGGGPNTTAGERRRGMHVSFCAGWLRTEENQSLAVPLEVVRTLPPAAQALLWGAHDAIAVGGGNLGTVAVQDPVALLASGAL